MLVNPQGEGTTLICDGLGTIQINLDREWVTATAFESGISLGCYAVGTGSGEFNVYAHADNYLLTDWGIEMPGGGSVELKLEYDDGFTLLDFGNEGN